MIWPLVVTLAMLIAGAPVGAQAGRILYADDFEGNIAGWMLATPDNGTLEVEDGSLTLQTTVAGQATWATPAVTVPDDIDLSVEVRPQNPATNSEWNFGILLRADRRDTEAAFYHFGVTGAGIWEFRARPKNAQTYTNRIESGELDNFDAQGATTIQIQARGNDFTFTINGVEVGKFTDDLINPDPGAEKYIGLMSGTYEAAENSTIIFRKLLVTEPGSGRVLLSEDFSNPATNGWSVGKSTDSEARFEANSLVIEVTKANIIRWSRPGVDLPTDLDVSVNVVNEGDGTDWGYGIGVRVYTEGDDTYFYLFEVRGTGEFTFTTQRGGNIIATLVDVTAISGFDPQESHRLRLVAKGETFTLYVDGRELTTVEDTSLESRSTYHILLSAGTFDAPTMRARFTDLVVQPAG